jgi:hypothetical protein
VPSGVGVQVSPCPLFIHIFHDTSSGATKSKFTKNKKNHLTLLAKKYTVVSFLKLFSKSLCQKEFEYVVAKKPKCS